ncbi:alpha/beta hydrolase [Hymenobacter sp. HSC-4F20]|uniref:alpha/beta fold hydrolase n=1 Tax=Hymenobacter sp. HSC-4F20 TaxID=2864135 RepID=UPI001C72B5E3|nr:alpha/beta hydrolase [Hymenobacter sp. HSC-4F20]MBX0293103.1 alpha/beta hydrolase [Hymenobacter sp. HSC-4F20]
MSRFFLLLLHRLLCLLLLLTPLTGRGQQAKNDLFEHCTLHRARLKSFTIHVTKSASKARRPLLVYLDGSGNFPLYYKTKSGRYNSSVPLDVRRYAKDYYVVVISKPGIPFQDSLRYSSSGRGYYPENDTFTHLYSLDWQAEAASATIDYVVKNFPIDTRKVIVIGYSEGSQVAPRVAVLNKKVTHVVCLVGNTLNHLYDFLLTARLQVERKQISPVEGQRIVDSLYAEYAKLYQSPKAVDQTWYGSTYLKWSSFSRTTPLENMLKLSIPILYIAGGRDNNQTIMSMDYAKLEFLRQGKTNLLYRVYPDCNHYFQEERVVNGVPTNIDRIDEVHQFAIDWANSAAKTI